MIVRGLKPSATFVASQSDALTIAAGFNLRFPKTEMHPKKSGLFQLEGDLCQLVKFFTHDYLIIIAIFYYFDV